MTSDDFWGRFRRWRRQRPFWGGLFLLLSALELLYSANMNLGGIELHLGPQGFLSYLLPLLLIAAGLFCWFTPAQRIFYGLIGLLTALYSFVGLNLGGFFVGMLLGIVGGALVIAWGPPRIQPGQEQTDRPTDGGPATEGEVDQASMAEWFGEPQSSPHDVDQTQRFHVAGHDDRPREEHLRRAVGDAQRFDDQDRPPGGPAPFGRNPKALATGLIALAVSATVLVAGSRSPASADDCPAGLPSRSATTTVAATTAAATKAQAAAATTKAAAAEPSTPKSTPTKTSTASPSPSTSSGTGNAFVDGFNDFIDGVGNLLGLGGDQSASPSKSPAPSASSSGPTGKASTTEPTKPASTATVEADATKAPASSKSVEPSASVEEIPCLGARVMGKLASPDDIPVVAAKAALLETASLTMYDSTYDGVVQLPTPDGGTIRALKFSMSKAVNEPFSLTIDDPAGGGQTVVKSDKLTVDKTVRFYTSRFEGNLFGLFPVVFTPDAPPPLMLPVLWFSNAKIQLNFVRCDTLTGQPLKITKVK